MSGAYMQTIAQLALIFAMHCGIVVGYTLAAVVEYHWKWRNP